MVKEATEQRNGYGERDLASLAKRFFPRREPTNYRGVRKPFGQSAKARSTGIVVMRARSMPSG